MKLGKIIDHLLDIQKKHGSDFDVRMIVEPTLKQEFIEGAKQADGTYQFQYETGVEDIATSEFQNAIFFLPKDF